MSIEPRVLGRPGDDNALLVRLDSGQRVDRLLFDCGEGCLRELDFSEVLGIDHVFFSHLHMDHVGGFDSFVRAAFQRENKPNILWGPPETARILQGRLRGYMWNLIPEGVPGTWTVHDVGRHDVCTTTLELSEAFAVAHDGGTRPLGGVLIDADFYTVECLTMNHQTPSLAFVVREKPRRHVDTSRLDALGLPPGPWLRQLKDAPPGQATVDVGGVTRDLAELRRSLLVETPGDSAAYLTDFILDDEALGRLVPALRGCGVVVCECQYRHADHALAERNYHMTTAGVGELARRADVGELVLFHLSGRYTPAEWLAMLEEVREVFPRARFSENWQIQAVAGGTTKGA